MRFDHAIGRPVTVRLASRWPWQRRIVWTGVIISIDSSWGEGLRLTLADAKYIERSRSL